VVVVQIIGLPPIASVSAGSYHNAAVAADGHLFVWGWNERGQCGLGDVAPHFRPTFCTAFPEPCRAVSCGAFHTLAIGGPVHGECYPDCRLWILPLVLLLCFCAASGTLYSWGDNQYGSVLQVANIHAVYLRYLA